MTVSLQDLQKIIADAAPSIKDVTNLDAEKSLLDQGLDSLDMSSILLEAEEGYNTQFPDADLDKFQTINQILEHINKAS